MSMTDLYKVFDQTVREITREVNRSILKVPEIEQKTLDATSNEPWGPHGQLMNEIAKATRNFHEFQMIFAILWKRLQDTGANWRHVYKSLVVMEFLVANGSDRVIDEMRENMYQISVLQEFQYVEPSGKDQGINVRKKAQTLVGLLKDGQKIREARDKAAANRNKYGGISSTVVRSGGFGSGGGGGYDSFEGGSRRRDDVDSYRGGAGGAGGRGEEGYGQRERDDVDRYRGREGGGYEEEYKKGGGSTARGGGEGGGWDDDEYKTDGYTRPGQASLPVDDDDDFAPRGKAAPAAAPAATTDNNDDDDWDDFDPRGSAQPVPAPPPARPPPPPALATPSLNLYSSAPSPAPGPASAAPDLLDLLGPGPTPASTPAPAAASAPLDPFAALTAPTPAAPAPVSVDLFGAPVSIPSAHSPFSSIPLAPPKLSSSTDFPDDDFGGFAAAPSSTAAPAAAAAVDPFASFASAPLSAPAAAKGPQSSASSLSSLGGVPKGGLWDDALSKGIVDLKISGGKKEDLSSLGILSDGLGVTSSSLNAASNVPFAQQAGGMGRAMGAGSGKGISGASSLSPSFMPTPSPVAAAAVPNLVGLGSPGSLGMQAPQPGLGFGAAGLAMPGFPGPVPGGITSPGIYGAAGSGISPGGSGLFPPPPGQHQQQNLNAFQF